VEAIRREAVDLALAAAGQLMQKSFDQPAQRAFVEQVIRDLPGNLKNLS
jgi:F0F1-type ATP synthase membrane subunit b/b'